MKITNQFIEFSSKVAEILKNEKVRWHIAFMGEIPKLGFLYLIAKPIAGEQWKSARVFIARIEDNSKWQEVGSVVSVTRGSGMVFHTSFGNICISSDYQDVKLLQMNDDEFPLEEFTFLN